MSQNSINKYCKYDNAQVEHNELMIPVPIRMRIFRVC